MRSNNINSVAAAYVSASHKDKRGRSDKCVEQRTADRRLSVFQYRAGYFAGRRCGGEGFFERRMTMIEISIKDLKILINSLKGVFPGNYEAMCRLVACVSYLEDLASKAAETKEEVKDG